MLEKTIVNAIKKALTEAGAFVFKTHGSGFSSGLPDLIACYDGQFIGIEVKTPKTLGTLTLKQQAVLERISEAGGIAGVATSPEEALALLGLH